MTIRSLWPIVLAGGEGRRMGPFIAEWLGEPRPKQYCTFVGSRSMLRHTWDRARAFALPDRVVTVLGRGHRRFLDDAQEPPGPYVEQPCDCGTAPGLFLGLTLVAARDPGATVVVMPADHFVHPEGRFLTLVETACRQAAYLPGRLVLLGARAHHTETDFGWILPGPQARSFAARRVEGFVEKPDRQLAGRLAASGALWSTMIVAARVDTLWRLGCRLLPAMMRPFRRLLRELSHPAEELPESALQEALARAYRHMPRADFSRDLLQRYPGMSVVMPLDGLEWSDWGRPERVRESLLRLGKIVADEPGVDCGLPALPGLWRGAPLTT